jgi:hypothetical protein
MRLSAQTKPKKVQNLLQSLISPPRTSIDAHTKVTSNSNYSGIQSNIQYVVIMITAAGAFRLTEWGKPRPESAALLVSV